MLCLSLFAQYCDSGFVIGLLNIGDQAPFEAGTQPLLQRRDLLGRSVGGKNYLLSGLMKGIKGIEKLGLCGILTRNKLNIVHKKHIGIAELFSEIGSASRMDGVNYLVGKGLTLGINNVKSGIFVQNIVFNGI